jgi:enamine deaminase RidA (YjgF/YER057c/UK114 family)
MTAITRAATPAPPWAPRPGETPEEHLAFLYWHHHGGPLDEALAARHDWTSRAQALTTLAEHSGTHAEQATKAAIQQVEILIAEMGKLHASVVSNPNSVLSPRDVFDRMEWLTSTIQGLQERNASMMDYSALSPEDREIMIRAAEIQERLIG